MCSWFDHLAPDASASTACMQLCQTRHAGSSNNMKQTIGLLLWRSTPQPIVSLRKILVSQGNGNLPDTSRFCISTTKLQYLLCALYVRFPRYGEESALAEHCVVRSGASTEWYCLVIAVTTPAVLVAFVDEVDS